MALQPLPVSPEHISNRKVFFQNLDGLRFLCFLSVFFYHSFATDYSVVRDTELYRFVKHFIAGNGNLGVNFFFVLSGFLITYLLLLEKQQYGRINIGAFYARRILRIWPLFYFCVFFGFLVFPWIKAWVGLDPAETASFIRYLFFLNNFDFIEKGLPETSVLAVLWSIAIEEQFYLIWPLLLSAFPMRYYPYLFGFIIAVSFLFRWYHADHYLRLEMHTLSCISDMVVGSVAALLAFRRKGFLARITDARKYWWALLYCAVGLVFLYRKEIFNYHDLLVAADRLVVSIIFALVILEQSFARHALFQMSRFKRLSKWGVYTYGLYCLHMIGILIASRTLAYLGWNQDVFQVIFMEGGLSLVITLALGWLSYHLYESRFLRLKDRFTPGTKQLPREKVGLVTR